MRFVGSQPDIEANVASGADVALRPVPLERLNVPRPERGAVAIPVSPLFSSCLAPAFNLTNERARAFCDRVAQGPLGVLQTRPWHLRQPPRNLKLPGPKLPLPCRPGPTAVSSKLRRPHGRRRPTRL